MQRKQLEKKYNVKIYQVSGSVYVIEFPDKKVTFKYMTDVEDYLKKERKC